MQRPIATAAASIAALLLGACAGTEASTRQADEVREIEAGGAEGEGYRISVEIPLDALRFEEDGILKVDELLAERTEFDPEDFRLDEVVLVARSDAADAATAELLVLEWRSGAVEIPRGGEQDWYEVRLPAPEEELGGAWLLDVHGATTVDFLVAVLAPRPAAVAERRAERVRTVHRTVDRTRYAIGTYWIYDPTRYYVYHYHDSFWPYRYFTGVWDFRYYDLRFRPRIHRFGHYRGPIYGGGWRDGYRRGWRDSRRAQERRARAAAPRPLSGWRDRRASAHLAALRRNHPRYGSARPDERSRPGHAPRERRGRRTDEARQRFEELTRASSRRSAPRRAGTADAQTRAALAEAAAASGRDAPRSFHRPARSRPTSRQPAASQPARTAPRHFERRRSPTARAQQSRHAAGGAAASNPSRAANPRRAFQAPQRAASRQASAASVARRSRPAAAARTAPPSVRAGTYERRGSAPRAAPPQAQRRAAAASRPAEGSAARRGARHARQSAPQRRSEPAPKRSREAAPRRSGEASAQARPQARRTRSRGFERRPRP